MLPLNRCYNYANHKLNVVTAAGMIRLSWCMMGEEDVVSEFEFFLINKLIPSTLTDKKN